MTYYTSFNTAIPARAEARGSVAGVSRWESRHSFRAQNMAALRLALAPCRFSTFERSTDDAASRGLKPTTQEEIDKPRGLKPAAQEVFSDQETMFITGRPVPTVRPAAVDVRSLPAVRVFPFRSGYGCRRHTPFSRYDRWFPRLRAAGRLWL